MCHQLAGQKIVEACIVRVCFVSTPTQIKLKIRPEMGRQADEKRLDRGVGSSFISTWTQTNDDRRNESCLNFILTLVQSYNKFETLILE